MVQNNPKLKSLINSLWDTLWSGGIANPLSAIEQITYLLFMKRIDEMDARNIKDMEWIGESYSSKFSGTYLPYVDERLFATDEDMSSQQVDDVKAALAAARAPRPASELRWSFFEHMAPAEKMLEHVRYNVFGFIRKMNGETTPFTKHMANAVFIIEKPSLLVEAVKKINEIFLEIEKDASEGGHAFQDIQGDVYEMLLEEIATAGKNGQFRTPRHIIKLVADLVQPTPNKRIADPACGTAGFLLGAYQYILSDLVRRTDPGKLIKDADGFHRGALSGVLTPTVKIQLEKNLVGYDIDITMVRLGLMNLMMHGIDNPGIEYQDTLSKGYKEEGNFDIVMANPPFTGNIDKGDINENLTLPTTKTELLFIERIFNMLKSGGTAAIIIPQGVLFGKGKAFTQIRKKIVEEAELTAVITLPGGVFKPYAGVATAILMFTKGGTTERTWFYDMRSDGYELNDKRTAKYLADGSRDHGDLQDIVGKYHSRYSTESPDRTAQYFFVDKQELEVHEYELSMNVYKEDIFIKREFEQPNLILCRLVELEGKISEGILGLKEIL